MRRTSVVEVVNMLLQFGELLAESVGRDATEEIQPAGDQAALNFFRTLEIGQDTSH